MGKINTRKAVILLTAILLIVGLATAGCKGPLSSSPKRGVEQPTGISAEERKKIRDSIELDTISIAPNSVGFVNFYGDVTNRSDKHVSKVQILAVSTIAEKGKVKTTGEIGRSVVEDLDPGETKSFNIVTSVDSVDLGGYEVKVEEIEL